MTFLRSLIICLVLVSVSHTSFAQGPTEQDCRTLYELAEQAMEHRQKGGSLIVALNGIDQMREEHTSALEIWYLDILEAMYRSAFEVPIHYQDRRQNSEIRSFAQYWYHLCRE